MTTEAEVDLDQALLADLTDEEIDEYLDIAFAVGTRTAFSKGTANVSPKDMAKLRPLLKFYAKKAHPFTACVNDNKKRFGALTNKYCAIIKDLIEGNTKWRNQKKAKNLSDETLFEIFALDSPRDFLVFLSEMTDEEVQELMKEDTNTVVEEESTELSDDSPSFLAELFLSGPSSTDEDGHVWKTIMREGFWNVSPSSEGGKARPIKVVAEGPSDARNLILSMAELKENFENGAVEHVTIPASHKDTVLENTGFIRKLRFGKDEQGRTTLEAAMDFTEPDVKEKALRGTIANTSAGVLFDYIHKESGKKFRSVLAHAALTNRPWLNGMKPFGVNASDDLKVIGFSEDQTDTSERREEMPDTPEYDFKALGFADEAELKAALEERKSLKAKDRERDVADLCQKWQSEGVSPALAAEAQAIMMSDEGATVLNLSEDNKDVALTASDIVTRLVNASPKVDLSEEPVSDEDVSADKPNDDEPNEAKLSQEEKKLATQLFFEQGLPMKEAVQKAKETIAAGSSGK